MFPSNPWKDISNEGIVNLRMKSFDYPFFLAISFIRSLLETNRQKRLFINKTFLQPWLQVENNILHELLFFSFLNCMFDCF
jgi:hypothetical protein